MSLLLMDSLNYSNVTEHQSRRLVGGTPTYVTGRYAGLSAGSINTGTVTGSFTFTPSAEVWLGFGFKTTTLSAGLSYPFNFLSEDSSSKIQIGFNSTTGLLEYRSNTTFLATSTKQIRNGNWYFIEIKAKMADSITLGDCQIYVNNELWINVPAASDTKSAAGSANIASFNFQGITGLNFQMQDLYVLNSLGSAPENTRLGDMRYDYLLPNGNGTTSQLLGSDGNSVDNYLLTDEVTSDADTTYVGSATVGQFDSYTMQDMTITPQTIFGINAVAIAKKVGAGPRTSRSVIRTGGTYYEGPDLYSSDGTYLGEDSIWTQNPNTVAPWIKADIDAIEQGSKVQS